MASPLLRPVPPALRVLLPPFPLLTPVLVHLHLILKLALPIPPSSLPSRRDTAAVVTRRPRPTRPFHLAASPAATSSSPCLTSCSWTYFSRWPPASSVSPQPPPSLLHGYSFFFLDGQVPTYNIGANIPPIKCLAWMIYSPPAQPASPAPADRSGAGS